MGLKPQCFYRKVNDFVKCLPPCSESPEFIQRSAFEFPSCNSAWPELTKTKGSFSTGCSGVWSKPRTNFGGFFSARSELGARSHQLILAALHHHLCCCSHSGHLAQPQLGCTRHLRNRHQMWSSWKGWGERRRPEVLQGLGLPAGNLAKTARLEQGGFSMLEVPTIHLDAATHDQATIPRYSVPGRGDHQYILTLESVSSSDDLFLIKSSKNVPDSCLLEGMNRGMSSWEWCSLPSDQLQPQQ